MTIQTTHLTLAQAKEVAKSVHAIRRDWNKPGIEDALGRARLLADAASVAIAAHRAAADPSNRTPAVIALDGAHWRDAAKPPHFPAPDAHERCSTCSQTEDRCQATWAKDHPFAPDLRPVAGTAADQIEALRLLWDERAAELCSHGVPLTNCLDHLKRRETDTDPTPEESA